MLASCTPWPDSGTGGWEEYQGRILPEYKDYLACNHPSIKFKEMYERGYNNLLSCPLILFPARYNDQKKWASLLVDYYDISDEDALMFLQLEQRLHQLMLDKTYDYYPARIIDLFNRRNRILRMYRSGLYQDVWYLAQHAIGEASCLTNKKSKATLSSVENCINQHKQAEQEQNRNG
jgi:hypothetical protein